MSFKVVRLAFGMAGALAFSFATSALADTLIDNVNGVTIGADGKVMRFTGLVIGDDGRVAQVLERGDERPRNVDYQLDGKGKVMLPGMIDAHAHVMSIGFGALTLDLSDSTSLDDALAKIAKFAAENPGRPWILGRGWNQEKWGLGRFPTAAELDAVVADRPVWLSRVDGHAGWANSLAMQRAKLNSATADPVGGRILRKPGSQAPEGVLVDNAQTLIDAVVPAPRPADRDLALAKAQAILLAHGITGVADMGTSIEDWQAFRRAGDLGTLLVRIMAYADSINSMELIAGPSPTPWLYNDRLRLNGVKLYIDGALGSRGALLKQPYTDELSHRGLALLTPAQLRNQMSRAALENFQIAVHAIGDAANAELLAAIDELSDTYTGDRRWRIEHAQIVDPLDLEAFGKHGIIASMQPLHQTSDRLMAEARLGSNRLEGAYAWRSMERVGATLAFGSDAPVEPPDVMAGIAAAISRTDANGQPFGGWLPQETVTREDALAAYTVGGAFAGFGEDLFGRLIPGEHADFVLVDRDPLFASPEDIRTIKVLETWVDGKPAYASSK